VICAETEEKAKFIASSRSINKILSMTGAATTGLIPPEEASTFQLSPNEKAYLEQSTQSYIEGDKNQVLEGILKASEKYETNDIGIVSNCFYFEDRKNSYSMVAECLGIEV
jgi:alkanesulfonate monooxygenase SsuD/methylene tetrahydromethanopterin reductase-like flavin-dependent oxidoreductase (luciferase family)